MKNSPVLSWDLPYKEVTVCYCTFSADFPTCTPLPQLKQRGCVYLHVYPFGPRSDSFTQHLPWLFWAAIQIEVSVDVRYSWMCLRWSHANDWQFTWNSFEDNLELTSRPCIWGRKALHSPCLSPFCLPLVISCNVALVSMPSGVLFLWYLCQMSWHVLN